MSCNADLNPDDFPIKRVGTKYKCPCCGVGAKISYKIPCYTEGYGIFPDRECGEFMLRYFKIIRRYSEERGVYDEVKEEMRETYCNGFVYTQQRWWDDEWRACNNDRSYYYQYSNFGNHWVGFGFNPRADYQRLYTRNLNIYSKNTQYENANLKGFFDGMELDKWYRAYSNLFDLMKYKLFAEYMQKVGLTNLLHEWRDDKFDFGVDYKQTKLREMLKITQPQYKELLALGNKASTKDLTRFHLVNKYGLKNEEEWEVFDKYLAKENKYKVEKFFKVFPFTLHKFSRWAEKQGDKFNLTIYVDYLNLAKRLNLDLKDYFVTFPKHLKEAHDELDGCYKEMQFDIKLSNYAKDADEKADKFNEVVKRNAKWCSENEQFEVVSPRSTHDLGLEGIKLRHCVAMYIDDIIKGEKVVMFLRRKSEPDVPFYTMEIMGNTITQCKGYRNTNRTEEVDKFLHKYAKKMNLTISDNEVFKAFV